MLSEILFTRPIQDDSTTGTLCRVQGQLKQLAGTLTDQDTVFVRQALIRLERINEQVGELLRNELRFTQTETWRTVYESILSACRIKRYLSVALIEHEDYWQDQPGLASLGFNYELVQFGFSVQRRFIIDDYFWPPGAVRPAREILGIIQQQAIQGIDVSLIRKSQLESEPQLICDLGIYGDTAAGYQTVDDECRTSSYVVRFGREAVEAAEEIWCQLDLYAVSLDSVLDQPV